jgi:hypothetical protein
MLLKIGGDTEGRVTAIISGSNSALLHLCYATTTASQFPTNRYPSFGGVSLNSGRYSDVRSRPIQSKEEFEAVIKHIICSSSGENNDDSTSDDDNDSSDDASTDSDNVKVDDFTFFSPNDIKHLKRIQKQGQLEDLYTLTGGKFRNLQIAVQNPKGLTDTHIRSFLQNSTNREYMLAVEKLCKTADEKRMAKTYSVWTPVSFTISITTSEFDLQSIYACGDSNLLLVEALHNTINVSFEAPIIEKLWKVCCFLLLLFKI